MSPVVGMILVLAVSVVGIAATLYWGLPAIDEMKANVEVRSMRSQFLEFLSDAQELAAGTAGKTAKHFQPSLMRGSLSVASNSERWIVSADMGTTDPRKHDFKWSLGPSSAWNDNVFQIWNNNSTSLAGLNANKDYLRAYLLNGAHEERIIVNENPSTTCRAGVITMWNFTTAWSAMSHKTFQLCRKVGSTWTPVNLNQHSVRVDIMDEDQVVSTAWLMNMGEMQWNLDAGVGKKELYVTNGALIEGTNGNYVFLSAPAIPPPKNTSSSYRFFGRVVELNGSASFGGGDRFDMVVNLYGTSALKDTDCDRATLSTCVVNVKMYPLGPLKNVWRDYFTNPDNGYRMQKKVNQNVASGFGADESFVMARINNGASFTLIRSVITASG